MIRRALILTTLLTACPAAEQDETEGPTTTAAIPGSTGAGSTTTASPPSATAADDAATSSAPEPSSTTEDAATSEPDVYFDLGVVPDAPDGKIPGCQSAVDIVFVMDVSTTMSSFINILSSEILVVDAALQALELPQPPHYGLAVFVDDVLLVGGGAPYVDALDLQADFDMWAAFTASNQQVGGGNSNSTWPENSLDALHLAATDFQWRPAETTIRLVIHTTDDTFWDGPTIGNGIMIQHGYADTVQALQDEEVRVYSFADDIGGSCSCLDVTPGWSSPYMGMLPIPEATDGSVYDIGQVLSGMVSLSTAINASVEESYCDPYTPQG
ncbi:MAG: vWA domain-containing protein [Nannocystaceae bacterium]